MARKGYDPLAGRDARSYQDNLRWQVRPSRERQARALARYYHEHVAALYTSKRGMVEWGKGVHDRESWNEYSKAYHRKNGPARWQNAGMDWAVEDGRVVVRLYPVHGSPAGNATIRLDYEAWRLRRQVEPVAPREETCEL